MYRLNKFFFFINLFFYASFFAQQKKIDSLKNELIIHEQKDTIRVNILNELAYKYYIKDVNKAQSYLDEAKEIINTIGYKKGKGKNLYVKGYLLLMKGDLKSSFLYFKKSLQLYKVIGFKRGIYNCYDALSVLSKYQSNYKESIMYAKKGLVISEEVGDVKGITDSLIFLGVVNSAIGNYSESLKYYKRALKLYKEHNNEKGINRCLHPIGEVYVNLGNYSLALEYLNKVLIYKRKNNDSIGVSNILNRLGGVYNELGYFDKSLEYHKQALIINNKKGNKREIARTNNYIGYILKNQKKYAEALKYANKALEFSKYVNDLQNESISLNIIGFIYSSLGKTSLAIKNFKKSESISLKNGNKPILSNSYNGLAKTYLIEKKYEKALLYTKKLKNLADDINSLFHKKSVQFLFYNIYKKTYKYKKALASFEVFKQLHDSLNNKKNIEKIAQIEYEYKYKQELDSAKIKELELAETVKIASKNLEKSQRNLLFGVIVFLLIALVLGAIIFFLKLRNAKTKTQNIIIEQKLLRSQMTPHFIFNSLSVLQGMILNNEQENSISYLSKFSKLLRTVLENSRHKKVLLTDELKAIESFIALQNLDVTPPYKYNLKVDSNINKSSLKIPPMLIQPFIENAIEHAFPNKKENKEINIELSFKNKKLLCVIKDNGIGINTDKPKNNKDKNSLATTITSERLKMLSKDFNVKGSLSIKNRKIFGEQGTLVTLEIPYKTEAA